MNYPLNDTHDTKLRSWVDSANQPETDFPIQNLPFGVFKRIDGSDSPRVGVAIGDQILDVSRSWTEGLLDNRAARAAEACQAPSLNVLMALGYEHWSILRAELSRLLRADEPDRRKKLAEKLLVPMAEAELLLPAEIGNFTDFYSSIYHARNVGSILRPDNPLLPNYKFVPVAYHGRSSSIVVSGTPVRRPSGQTRDDKRDKPNFGPTRLLDYELEVGLFVGPGNSLGEPIPMGDAEAHLFGLCLLNDWSARDIQAWEYQPLGPFLAKSFATTISPWIVSMEALRPFRAPAFPRPEGDPEPMPYLSSPGNKEHGGIDLTVEVFLLSEQMRARNLAPMRLSRSNLKDIYWTAAQMLTHHASNGCNLRPGDLLGSGTVSGSAKEARSCLLELTWRGSEPIQLPTGEARRFLDDGDEVIMRGYCERPGFARIGCGECRGLVLPASERMSAPANIG